MVIMDKNFCVIASERTCPRLSLHFRGTLGASASEAIPLA